MSCFCRKGARCLPCIEAAGVTRTPPEKITVAQLTATVGELVDAGRPIPSTLLGEIRRRKLAWSIHDHRLIARPS